MKPVIRLGDPTDHGGNVTSASSTTTMFGKAVALVGDSVSCPQQGHTNCVIVEGDPSWTVGGKGVALQGHKVSCGATLISTLGQVMRSYEGSGTATTGAGAGIAAAAALASAATAASFDEQIRFFTSDRNALADTPYKLTLADGSTIEGRTDAGGKTQRISTDAAQEITCAEFFPDTFYGCACAAEHMCEAGGRAPAPALKVELKGVKTNAQAVGSSVVNETLPPPDVRPMTAGEIAMAKTVFKDSLDYGKVKIHNGGLMGQPNRSNNAMTPKGEIHFPTSDYLPDYSTVSDTIKIWFIHEMGHVWQYQMGYSVVWAGIKLGAKGGYSDDGVKGAPAPAYRYNLEGADKGKTLPDFNMEQQADLIAHYYAATQLGMPRYIADLPALEKALAGFLVNPKDESLLPNTTQVESAP
ncbi:PAAR domain-containing protein [Chromobacterium vaccinii]|uniref:PAAR domain-containing protein n=1 Tax=Chromobacterium vaccinii TaxID=1108595 RepID=UPI0009E46982|nr:PAAR domain-containing protein [Chromobacterium vaccinii]